MFLGMQGFDFAQILSLLPKSNQVCPKFFPGVAAAPPTSYSTAIGLLVCKHKKCSEHFTMVLLSWCGTAL